MFVIDLKEGRIIDDEEIKSSIISSHPYSEWVKNGLMPLETLAQGKASKPETEPLLKRQKTFGYTEEDQHVLLAPMAINGKEPTGSMGNDAALPILSERPVLLFNYFKQLFAQVTNPPIDPIREELVMSLRMQLGPVGNLLEESPTHVDRIALKQPILYNSDLAKIRDVNSKGLKAQTFSTLFKVADGSDGMKAALSAIFEQVSQSLTDGVNLVILSDKGSNSEFAPIPILLAVSAVHHNLIRAGVRNKASIIAETGEAREVNHFALLAGYGAGAVNPYLAFESISDLKAQGDLPDDLSEEKAHANYIKAINKGMLKVFSKMGISTLFSYCGAQIFEAIGLNKTGCREIFLRDRIPY